MKQLKTFLSLIILILTVVQNTVPSANAQTDTSHEDCTSRELLINTAIMSRDGKYLVANWLPNTIRIWNFETGTPISNLTDETIQSEEERVALSPDNKYIVTGKSNGIAILWDTISGKKIRTLARTKNSLETKIPEQVMNLSFSPNGDNILMVDTTAGSLWNVTTGKMIFEFSNSLRDYPFAQFSPGGKKINIEEGIWDTQTGQLLHEFDAINNAIFSPDGKYIFTEGVDGDTLWDSEDFSKILTFEGTNLEDDIHGWGFSPNGKYMSSDEGQQSIIIWDVTTGKRLYNFTTHVPIAGGVFFGNSQRFLFPESFVDPNDHNNSATVYAIRNLVTGEEIKKITIDENLRIAPRFYISPNDKYLLTASSHGTLKLWNIETGEFVRQYC